MDALLVQPFINYNFSHGWYVTTSPIITANWLAASNERWTVPIGAGVGKILKLGKSTPLTMLALGLHKHAAGAAARIVDPSLNPALFAREWLQHLHQHAHDTFGAY